MVPVFSLSSLLLSQYVSHATHNSAERWCARSKKGNTKYGKTNILREEMNDDEDRTTEMTQPGNGEKIIHPFISRKFYVYGNRKFGSTIDSKGRVTKGEENYSFRHTKTSKKLH